MAVKITTPEGADLPATTTIDDFPLLIRLNSDCFKFSQAMTGGDDIRFSTAAGVPLFYEIEEWESSKGTASILIWQLLRTNAIRSLSNCKY